MLYRRLGKTGCDVSVLGFGCMRLPVRDAHQPTDFFNPAKALAEVEAVITQSAATPRDGQGPSDPIAFCSEDLWETRLDFTGITSELSAESAKSG